MISIEYVPVQIIETGEKVKARIEIDPLKKEVTYIKLQSQRICNYDTCLIKIGSKIIPFDLMNVEEGIPLKITLECKEELPYLEWLLIINNAFRGITINKLHQNGLIYTTKNQLKKIILQMTRKSGYINCY